MILNSVLIFYLFSKIFSEMNISINLIMYYMPTLGVILLYCVIRKG